MIRKLVKSITEKIYRNMPVSTMELDILYKELTKEEDAYPTTNVMEMLIHFQKKFHIIILTNNKNKFLKAFNYEDIINSPIQCSEDNCTPCKPIGTKEAEDDCQDGRANEGMQGD